MENTERYNKEPSKADEYKKLVKRFNFTFSDKIEYPLDRQTFFKPFCLINYSKPRLVTIVYDDDIVVLTDVS